MKLPSEHPQAQLIAKFAITGEPISKARARFSGRGSSTRTYTPEKTRAGEELMALTFRSAAPGYQPIVGTTYGVEAEFRCGTAQRRDTDNMLKLILDGLNGVAWVDDQFVTSVIGEKRLVIKSEAGTTVRIYDLGPIRKPQKICTVCDVAFEIYPNSTTKQHCSRACSLLARQVMLTCLECSNQYVKPKSWADNGRALCSTACRRAHWATNISAAASSCPQCGCPKAKASSALCKACAGEQRKLDNAARRLL